MRIFVALEISEKFQQEISAWENNRQHLPARWIAPKNLHITLLPPWEENNIDLIKNKLKDIKMEFDSIDLGFNSISYGPNPREPRLIWASGQAPNNIILLKKKIEESLYIKSEPRKFLLHLTLARFNQYDFKNFKVKEINERVDWNDVIKSFVIMESRLLPGGADYVILDEFNL